MKVSLTRILNSILFTYELYVYSIEILFWSQGKLNGLSGKWFRK